MTNVFSLAGVITLFVSGITIVAALSTALAAPLDEEVAKAKLFRKMNHFIVNNRHIKFELSENPQPFLDWGFVRAGYVEYVGKDDGEIVPLSGPHSYDNPDDIRAVPFGVASGVRIRVQPARRGQRFSEVLKPNFPWENDETEVNTLIYDEIENLYKVWYEAKEGGIAYAESEDFVHWKKPLKTIRPYRDHERTNLIGVANLEELLEGELQSAKEARPGASGAFFIDPSAPPEQRYKTTFLAHTKKLHYDDQGGQVDKPVSAITGPGSTVLFGAVSADGIAWRVLPQPLCYHDADTQTVTKYDTLLKKYVVYTRLYELSRRSIGLIETTNFRDWPLPVNILAAGPEHSPSVDFYANAFSFYPGQPQIRVMFCLVYDRATDSAHIQLVTSRDGRTFHFTPGAPVIPQAEPNEVGHGMLIAKPGLVRIPDGRMLVVYSAWKMPHKFPRHHLDKVSDRFGELYAWWPQDRMVALEAPASGEFSTVPFKFKGNRLVLNMSANRTGGVQVEVRDDTFRPIAGRTFSNADTLYGDHMAIPITWNGASDLSAYRDQTIYLRFRLRGTKLFSIKTDD